MDYNPVVCSAVGYDAQSFAGLSESSPEKRGSDEKGGWQNKYSRFTKNGKCNGTTVTYLERLLCSDSVFSCLLCLPWNFHSYLALVPRLYFLSEKHCY